jgi:periplasmic protein TonB
LDFAQQQRNPSRHLLGFTIVVIMHVIVGYALVTGLARKVVEAIKQPIETKIIEELKKPPPDTPPPPPPKLAPPPPPFIPPPEVQIQIPVAAQQAAITNVTTVKPTAPTPPPAPPVVRPAPTNVVGIACPNSQRVRTEIQYPKEAIQRGISGEVLIEFTVDGHSGEIKDTQVLNSSNRVFDRVSLNAVKSFNCTAQGRDVKVQVPFVFNLKD